MAMDPKDKLNKNMKMITMMMMIRITKMRMETKNFDIFKTNDLYLLYKLIN
jgi:hypothetical protein